MRIPSNKISIYLIKEQYIDHKDILDDSDILGSINIPSVGIFYYGASHDSKPDWIDKFFVETLPADISLFNASASGLLLVEIEYKNKRRIFAIPFGRGWQFLKEGVREENFGLKTALNLIDPLKIRKMDRKNMSLIPKNTSEQLSRSGGVADFGLDIEQDLVSSVTGKSTNPGFGTTVSGKDSLSVSVLIGIHSIKTFLIDCMERYESTDYKKYFDWIDQIGEIRSPGLKLKLDAQLIDCLKKGLTETIWMAVPEIVDWENISGFRYSGQTSASTYDDLSLEDFFGSLSRDDKTSINIPLIKERLVYAIRADNGYVKRKWTIYNCIYAELIDPVNKNTYLLSNGKWYQIAPDFTKMIIEEFEQFKKRGCSVKLPACSKENEFDYNQRIAKELGYCLMDKKLITHGGGHSQIEFCDLFTKNKKIIHIKQYGGSSVLSHLFFQGMVSGELFLSDKVFINKVNEKLEQAFKFKDVTILPDAREYEVVFGIISSSSKELEIPFFSKISLRSAIKRLQTFGYRVSLLKIQN